MSRIAEIRERLSQTPSGQLSDDISWLLTRLEEAEKVIEQIAKTHPILVDCDCAACEGVKAARRWLEGEG